MWQMAFAEIFKLQKIAQINMTKQGGYTFISTEFRMSLEILDLLEIFTVNKL